MNKDEHSDPAAAIATAHAPVDEGASEAHEPTRGAAASPNDHLQVDVGGYQIFQGDAAGALIAELYVEVDPNDPANEKVRIEHWGLYPASGWVTPSASNPTPRPLSFVRVDRWDSAATFLSSLRTIPNAKYVKARCVTMAL